MNQEKQKFTQKIYEQTRKKYPQKLNKSIKQQILVQIIKKYYLNDFINIFHTIKNQINKNKDSKVKKVLDQNQNQIKDNQQQHKLINSKIVQCVKIIVQNQHKNQENETFNFKTICQKIQNVKIQLKDRLKNKNIDQKEQKDQNKQALRQKKQDKNGKNNQQIDKKQEAKKMQLEQEQIKDKQSKQIKQASNKPIQTKQVKKPIIQQVAQTNKPKSNSLFVQKQVPLTEQNIFKGQNFGRPSSGLHNKILNPNQKPKSSTKSNRSKRSNRSKSSRNQSAVADNDNSKLSDLQVNQQGQSVKKYTKQSKNSEDQGQINDNDQEQNEQIQEGQQQNQNQVNQQKKLYDLTDESSYLPRFKLSNQSPVKKKSPVQTILTNPYIKKAFAQICKQNYIGGGKTFDSIAQSADTMTINKWMVFCKQFDFLSTLKRKQLVDIYHQCTQNKTFMNQKQFLQGLIILQNKLKVDQQDFIRKKICLDSDLAFRQKVSSFKINYSGPKYNYFEESNFLPVDKYYQSLREQKYKKQKQKTKQYILHQGKFQQQIQYEINQRKKSRILGKSTLNKIQLSSNKKQLQYSIEKDNYNKIKNQNLLTKSPYLKFLENKSIAYNKSNGQHQNQLGLSKMNVSRRIDPLTYSDIYKAKGSLTERAATDPKKDQQKQGSSNLQNSPIKNKKYQIKSSKSIQKVALKTKDTSLFNMISSYPIQNQQKSQPQSIKNSPITRLKNSKIDIISQTAPSTKPQRQWTQNIKNWAQQFDKSQSQQSDEILRQHLINQKSKENKNKLLQKGKLSRIMNQMKNDQKWLQQNQDQNWDRQTQLQITKNKERFK